MVAIFVKKKKLRSILKTQNNRKVLDLTFIETVGKDNKTHRFKYTTENRYDSLCKVTKLCFLVYFANRDYNDYFDFKLTPIDQSTTKVTDMFLDAKGLFKGKGLPEALIIEAKRLFPDKQIISSTNSQTFKQVCNEWRSEQGSCVWNRLVAKNLARYDKDQDLYYLY